MNSEQNTEQLLKARKYRFWLELLLGGGVLLAAGIGIGFWFAQHYRVVPIDEPVTTRWEQPKAQVPANTPVQPPAIGSGPFKYQFDPGETLRYALTADILGSGVENALDPMDIQISMESGMSLLTNSVDPFGTGDLSMRFDTVQMQGNFMGSPVELYKDTERTVFNMAPYGQLDTAQGDSTAGIPQLEFFETPVQMKIARNGVVQQVAGPEGFQQMLSAIPAASVAQFPSAQLEIGQEWISDIHLPVPGVQTVVPAKLRNRLTRYVQVGNRRCAEIVQEIDSSAMDGKMLSPESALGEMMGFTMPKFELNGTNTIYFDVENGHLVQSSMQLHFGLILGQEMKGFAELLGTMGNLLNELEGKPAQPQQREPQNQTLMELGCDISAHMNLEEVIPAGSSPAAGQQQTGPVPDTNTVGDNQ